MGIIEFIKKLNPFQKEDLENIPVNVPIKHSYNKYEYLLSDAEIHVFNLIFKAQSECQSLLGRESVAHLNGAKSHATESKKEERRIEIERYLDEKMKDKSWQVEKNSNETDSFRERKLIEGYITELVSLDWDIETKRIKANKSIKPALFAMWSRLIVFAVIVSLSFIYKTNIKMFLSDALDWAIQVVLVMLLLMGLGSASPFIFFLWGSKD